MNQLKKGDSGVLRLEVEPYESGPGAYVGIVDYAGKHCTVIDPDAGFGTIVVQFDDSSQYSIDPKDFVQPWCTTCYQESGNEDDCRMWGGNAYGEEESDDE